jgi:hypothetical protein
MICARCGEMKNEEIVDREYARDEVS